MPDSSKDRLMQWLMHFANYQLRLGDMGQRKIFVTTGIWHIGTLPAKA